jgi:hypothetical protein
MSELKVNKVTPRSGTTVTLGDSGDSVAIPSGVGFNGYGYRNIVINGDMSIAQRSTSVASITSTGYYTVDRMNLNIATGGTWTQSQDTDVPSGQGFATSLKMDCTTANASLSANSQVRITQPVEAQNLQYLKYGTSNAQSLTLSFWVKSNKTGTYVVWFYCTDDDRQNAKSYTIDVANTWEKKTLTISGDTTGIIDNNNEVGMEVAFILASGTDYTSGTSPNGTWEARTNANRYAGQTVNLADDTANDWYITGVQLEAGTTASDFEFLPVDVNLNRCLRYFEKIANGSEDSDAIIGSGGYVYQTNVLGVNYQWYPKRATPSIYQTSGTDYFRYQRDGATEDFNSIKIYIPNYLNGLIYSDDGFTGTSGSNGWVQLNNALAYLGLNAEL